MATRPEWITDVRWYATEKQGANGPEARGSLTVADALYVAFVVWANRDGSFQVQLPRTANPKFNESQPATNTNKKFFEEAGCTSGPIREAMTVYIVDQLMAERSSSGSDSSSASGYDSVIPF